MPTRFHSAFAADFDAFLALHRALGHPYHRGAYTLQSFDRYVHRVGRRRRGRLALEPLILGWLATRPGRKPVTVTNELGVIRQFCRFRQRQDPRAFVPPRHWAPQSTTSVFLPTVLSKAAVRTLLAHTRQLHGPVFHAQTIATLLRVLYCTGLRFGEALRLTVPDVDLSRRVLRVRESKGKTRLVPFRGDLAHLLRCYLRTRRRYVRSATADHVFLRPDGRPYTSRAASDTVRRLLRRAGLKPPTGREGPRPYDLRHYPDRRIIPTRRTCARQLRARPLADAG